MKAKAEQKEAGTGVLAGYERHELLLATVPTAAAEFSVSTRTIYSWVASGAPAFRAGKRVLFHLPQLESWVEFQRLHSPDFGRWGGCRW